jgi:hypothetical protein
VASVSKYAAAVMGATRGREAALQDALKQQRQHTEGDVGADLGVGVMVDGQRLEDLVVVRWVRASIPFEASTSNSAVPMEDRQNRTTGSCALRQWFRRRHFKSRLDKR